VVIPDRALASNGRARASNDAGAATVHTRHVPPDVLSLLPCPDPFCGAPAEIADRITVGSTHGPIAHVRTLCLDGHRFFLPESVTAGQPLVTDEPAHSETGRSG
jgi:hypothetical protein